MDAGTLLLRDLAVILLAASAAGWIARRIGLSPVVGYLLAGILIGTPELAYPYVTDQGRIQLLSQLGLVFLMFTIGLGLRIQRIRSYGIGLPLATFGGALLVLNLTRGISSFAGLPSPQGLFLASMLMVSSSAIIGKVLEEGGLGHQRHGQLTLGMTLLEDVVAVVMLTFLSSYSSGGGGMSLGAIGQTVGVLAGFVLLMVVVGLLLVPRILHRVNSAGAGEIETILLTGLAFASAVLAINAGYSVALGAFLLGIIVAETPRVSAVQRAFGGLRDVFTTVFFVAIGMVLDVGQIVDALPLIIGGTLLAIFGRSICVTVAVLLTGEDTRTAVRTGLSMTPIGEFSFIIAGMGVASGALPEKYQVAAVGISLLTSFIGPLLISRSDKVASWLIPEKPIAISRALEAYRRLLRTMAEQGSSSRLWQRSRGRLVQGGVELLFLSALLTFSRPITQFLLHWEALGALPDEILFIAAWVLIIILSLVPFVALLLNADALIRITLSALAEHSVALRRLKGGLTFGLRVLTFFALWLWISAISPLGQFRGWVLVVFLLGTTAVLILGWRRLARFHSRIETEMQEKIGGNSTAEHAGISGVPEDWGLQMEELTLPDYTAHAGRTIAQVALRQQTGCTILSVSRQGFSLDSPSPQTHLFPGDELLLLGTASQIAKARSLLNKPPTSASSGHIDTQRDLLLESISLGEGCRAAGHRLAELNWPRLFGAQVVAVRRGDERVLLPGADFIVREGDELLISGTRPALRRVAEAAAPADDAP